MSLTPLFGILILDREPYRFSDLAGLAQAWLQDGGGFVFFGLAIYLIYALVNSRSDASGVESNRERTTVAPVMLLASVVAFIAYAIYIGLLMMDVGGLPAEVIEAQRKRDADPIVFAKREAPKVQADWQSILLTIGGLASMAGAAYPFIASLKLLRMRRISALAWLAFTEAYRNKLVWIFLLFLLPILFPVDWFLSTKAENELRMRVTSLNLFSQVLVLLSAGLIAAFAIPNDVKSQNIYTIVTKPVIRFEIVLGRFMGYAFLITIALLGMSLVGLIFIETAKVHPKSVEETFTARVPVRGDLSFKSRRQDFEGTDVGREFSYRKYIAGHPLSPQRAIWSFTKLPAGLAKAEADSVPCEMTFDIFRLTKGEENRGVDVNIRVTTWKCGQRPPDSPQDGTWVWTDLDQEAQYKGEARRLLNAIPSFQGREVEFASVLAATSPNDPNWPALWAAANTLAEKFGYFEILTKEVYDYHPTRVVVPAGLFRNAFAGQPPVTQAGRPPEPFLTIYVKCASASQMLGMAEPDLFLMEAEQPFWQNYLKSAVGIWCRVILVLGLSICLSTYLAGVVTFLVTGFLFIAGFFTGYLAELATGLSTNKGPLYSLNQLVQAQQPTMPDDGSVASRAALTGDKGFAWIVRRFVNMVPDVEAYSWTQFVSEGFNIPLESLIMNLLTLAAYLLPWMILGFFLMRSREVAA